MTTTEEYITSAIDRPYKKVLLSVKPELLVIFKTDKHLFIFEKNEGYYWKKEGRLYMSYSFDSKRWSLYVPDVITNRVFKLLCKCLKIESPKITIFKFKLREIADNQREFPAETIGYPRKEEKRDGKYPDNYITRLWQYPTPENTQGETKIQNDFLTILDSRITRITDVKALTREVAYMCNWKLILPNGINAVLERAYNKWDKIYLCGTKLIGAATVKYPIDLDGKPLREDTKDFWEVNYGHNKFYKALCENELEVPDEFDFDMMKYHFYGKKITNEMIMSYMKLNENSGCQCERCRGFLLFQAENDGDKPYYSGWSKDHYKCIHAAHKGGMPTDMDMIMDCDCKACKAFRNTISNKENLQHSLYSQKFRDKLYSANQRKYLTAEYMADFCIKPEDIKDIDKSTVTDFHWRSKARYFKNIFEDERNRSFPIKFEAIQLRYRYAYLHCRLTGVEYKDIEIKANEWLLEVFTTLMKPKCECAVCMKLKEKDSLTMDIFQELLLERVDQRSYPTAIVGIHFDCADYWSRNTAFKKKDMFDYFEKYILFGKFCDCSKCLRWRDKIAFAKESAKFLPADELKAPKCPLCGGAVHNKDLIYDNLAISKAIIKQGMDRMIGVKTALCCGCYGKFAEQGRRRELLFNLDKGEYIRLGNKTARIRAKTYIKIGDDWIEHDKKTHGVLEEDDPSKETLYIVIKHGQGELQTEEWLTLNQFAGMQYEFKLPKRLEDQVHVRRKE